MHGDPGPRGRPVCGQDRHHHPAGDGLLRPAPPDHGAGRGRDRSAPVRLRLQHGPGQRDHAGPANGPPTGGPSQGRPGPGLFVGDEIQRRGVQPGGLLRSGCPGVYFGGLRLRPLPLPGRRGHGRRQPRPALRRLPAWSRGARHRRRPPAGLRAPEKSRPGDGEGDLCLLPRPGRDGQGHLRGQPRHRRRRRKRGGHPRGGQVCGRLHPGILRGHSERL